MKKTTTVLTLVLGIGMAIQVGRAEAQGTAAASATKTASQGTSSNQATTAKQVTTSKQGTTAKQGTTSNQGTTAKKGTTAGSGTATKPKGTTSAAGARVTTLKDAKEKTSYAMGMNVGGNLHSQGLDLNVAIFLQGVKDAMTGAKTLMTDEEMAAALNQLQVEMMAKDQEKAKVAGEANLKEGEAFLAANKDKPGVVTLPDGLQYKILVEGSGPKPALTDSVVCNYQGTLINGKEFDSSYKRGKPSTFPVGRVIKGWTEALQLMPAGSKWQLFVPSELAYGDRTRSADIGPNATLIFEVELISIAPKQ